LVQTLRFARDVSSRKVDEEPTGVEQKTEKMITPNTKVRDRSILNLSP